MTLSSCKKIVYTVLQKSMIDFYCLIILHSYTTENKLKKHKNICKNHDCCFIEMPKEESIMKYNHGEKSMI